MNRRDFVARLGGSVVAGGATAASVAVASRDKASAMAQDGWQFARREIKALNARLDDVDESHKRLFRALVAGFRSGNPQPCRASQAPT